VVATGADFAGTSTFTAIPTSNRAIMTVGHGQVRSIDLAGARSDLKRAALVYLPPQYFQSRYAHTRFPVAELLHGTPGSPSAWIVHLRIVSVMNDLIARHVIGPMIVVMPTMSVGRDYQECVDAPGALDDTYITYDVRADISAAYRASLVPAEWGVGGYSSGGYCAANLALRHRAYFGASGIMDGYFEPQDGPAAKALHDNPMAEAANDPLRSAAELPADVNPLPAFWLSTGTGDKGDVAGVRAFATALHGIETVSVYQVPGAGHDFYAWQVAVPYLIQWMWSELAPPDLRVQFPTAGTVHSTTVRLSPSVRAVTRAGSAARLGKSRGHAPASPPSTMPASRHP
jgi:enterochelin esterase-like enzyme